MEAKMSRLILVLMSVYVYGLTTAKESNKLTITGHVVDYMARPVEGAEVAIYEGEYRNDEFLPKIIAPMVKTNQQGQFELQADVSSQYNTFIVARKAGLAIAWNGLNCSGDVKAKGKGHVLLVLEKPCTLAGAVVDHNGKAVPGAKVQAIPKTSYISYLSQRPIVGPREWFTTKTDSQGIFCFNQFAADVSSDLWIQTAESSCTYKFTTHYQPRCGFEVWRSDIRLVLPREGNIKGRVVEAKTGKPVGGVQLIIQADRDREDILNRYCACTVVCDADGWFVCTGLPEGKHKIELVAPESQIAEWVARPVHVNVVPDRSTDDIRVLAEKGGIVEYTVREYGTEKALSEIRISTYNERFSARSVTNETGAAKVRVLPGEYQAYAGAEGYTSWRVNVPVVVTDDKVTYVDILLTKSPTISGAVTDASGRLAEDILVTIHPAGDHTYTDKEGRFVAEYNERLSEQGLYIIARDLERSLTALFRTNEFNEAAQLSLSPALSVKGKVTDHNGAGIPAARVSLCIIFANYLSEIGAEVLTDNRGRFEFRAIPAKSDDFSYLILVHAAGFAPKTDARISIQAQPAAVADLGHIQLKPANLSVSGTVVDANGLPAPGVIIFLNGLEGIEQPDRSTATNEKGQFTIKQICEGPVRIQANITGAGILKAQAGDQDVKVVLGQSLVHSRYQSLTGKSLPDMSKLGINLGSPDVVGKGMVVCFFDMNQRSSRHCVRELAKQAHQLRQEGVIVLAVQASKVDENTLKEWVKEYDIPFPVGMVQGDAKKTRFAWGVRSLPWLILTDTEHIVRAEGFGLEELAKKIQSTE